MSRTTKIIIIVAVLLLIGALVYLFLIRGKGGEGEGGIIGGLFGGGSLPSTGGAGSGGGGGGSGGNGSGGGNIPLGGTLPITQEEEKRLVQLSKDPVIGPAVKEKEGKILYFKRGVGHLFENDFDGAGGEVRLSNLTITDIFDAKWSLSRSYAFLTALDGDSIKNYWLHLTSTSTIESGIFQNKIVSASFSPAEERLASLINVNGTYSLYTSNPDGTKAKTVLSTKIQDFEVSWITKDLIALKTKASAFAPSLLQLFSTTGADKGVLSSERKGFDILWNYDGSEYLWLEVDDRRQPRLFTENRTTFDKAILSDISLPEKCVFSAKTKGVLFCAIPSDQNKMLGLVLPDDWWQGKVQFEDEIWKIDLTKEGASEIILQGGGFDIISPILSQNENYIFFINKKASTLWSYRLL